MKILYAIQATGNGHISRAEALLPFFKNIAEVDILVSGISADIKLDYPIKYRFKGLSFIFGKNGGIDVWKTIRSIDVLRFLKDVNSLDLKDYDVVINDFEPVSAWASVFEKKRSIALSHQYSLLNSKVPKSSKKAFLARIILKYYAPAKEGYGFHFQRYDENIFTPIIKNDLIGRETQDKNQYVVYLPAYNDQKIIAVLHKISFTNWIVFSKHTLNEYRIGNISFYPISKNEFNNSLLISKGIICGAGFETPAEALYLKKKLLVIPMKNQYEQQCNAEALKKLGVPVLNGLEKKDIEIIKSWVKSKKIVKLDYIDTPSKVINQIFIDDIRNESRKHIDTNHYLFSSDF